MNSTLFSILVPIYNVEDYLEECIQSVINQTYSNWQLILVDDGSTDKSGIIADRYSKMDERISVHHKTNQGLLHTRRYAIQFVQGDYCVFLDSDDSLELNALEVLNKYILERSYDCIVYGYRRVTDDRQEIRCVTEPETLEISNLKDNIIKLVCDSSYNPLCRKAIKKRIILESYTEYNLSTTQGEDLLQSVDIILNCETVLYIKDVLYRYRLNMKSVSHTSNTIKQQNDIIYVRSYVLERIIQSGVIVKKEDYIRISSYYQTIFVNILYKLADVLNSHDFRSLVKSYKDSVLYLFIDEYLYITPHSGKRYLLIRLIKCNRFFLSWLCLKTYSYAKKVISKNRNMFK